MTTPTTGACSSGAGEGACPPGPELGDAHPARSTASAAVAHPAFHPADPVSSALPLRLGWADGRVPTVTHSADRAIAPGRGDVVAADQHPGEPKEWLPHPPNQLQSIMCQGRGGG